jgi:hypothetical protein
MDNWQDIYGCFGDSEEALSTRCVGLGVVVFYGMAKLARTPQGRNRRVAGTRARRVANSRCPVRDEVTPLKVLTHLQACIEHQS